MLGDRAPAASDAFPGCIKTMSTEQGVAERPCDFCSEPAVRPPESQCYFHRRGVAACAGGVRGAATRQARCREGRCGWMRGLITVALATSLAGGGCKSNTEFAVPTSAAPAARQPPAAGPTPVAAEAAPAADAAPANPPAVPPLPGEPSDLRIAIDDFPQPPLVVPQVALEAQRVAGEKNLMPGQADAKAMAASGKGTVGVVKMCLDDKGVPAQLTLLKSTNYPDYDARINAGMRAWRYEPFRVEGKPVPVCTSVDIIYRPR